MRKDAKIGFAIGGVLLAVLTIYAIVVPKKTSSKPTGVTLVIPPAGSRAQATPSEVTEALPLAPVVVSASQIQ